MTDIDIVKTLERFEANAVYLRSLLRETRGDYRPSTDALAEDFRTAATLISQLRNRLSDLEGWSEDMTKAPMKPGVKIDVLLQIGERITLGWWFQQKPGSVGWWTDGHWPVKPDKWMAIPSPSPSPPIPAVEIDGEKR